MTRNQSICWFIICLLAVAVLSVLTGCGAKQRALIAANVQSALGNDHSNPSLDEEIDGPAGGMKTDEQIYVSDSGNSRIVRCNDMTGALWTTYGGKEESRSSGNTASNGSGGTSDSGRPYGHRWGGHMSDNPGGSSNTSGGANNTPGGTSPNTPGGYSGANNPSGGNTPGGATPNSPGYSPNMNGGANNSPGGTSPNSSRGYSGANSPSGGAPAKTPGMGFFSSFGGPTGITMGPDKKIYIFDPLNKRIIRMDDMSGTGMLTLDNLDVNVNTRGGIAVDRSGRIYVVDGAKDCVIRVDNMSGAGLTTLGQHGSGPKTFNAPQGIAIGPDGKIYVADRDSDAIVCFDDMTGAGWKSLSQTSNGNYFRGPTAIAFGPDRKMYVTNTGLQSIDRLNDITGKGWTHFNSDSVKGRYNDSDVGRFQNPVGIAVGADGRIYVVDAGSSRIVRFNDMTGKGWITLDDSEDSEGGFDSPNCVLVCPRINDAQPGAQSSTPPQPTGKR